MEIEIRAFIDNIDSFKKNILRLGGKFDSEKHIIDYWYCDKNSTRFEQVQQNEPGSYGLRIRRIFNEGTIINELTCKVLKSHGDHNAFHEHETKIENFEECQMILEDIGFKIFCILDKKRTTYRLENCSINVEDIKGFRPAVELEIISDIDTDKHKKFLRNLLDKLQIREEDKIEKSITYLYMKENSFKKAF